MALPYLVKVHCECFTDARLYETSITLFRKIFELIRSDIDENIDFLIVAHEYRNAKKYTEAEYWYSQANAQNDPGANYTWGFLSAEEKKEEKSRGHFEVVYNYFFSDHLSIKSKQVTLAVEEFYQTGLFFQRINQPIKAIKFFISAYQKSSHLKAKIALDTLVDSDNYPEISYLLGEFYENIADFSRASRFFKISATSKLNQNTQDFSSSIQQSYNADEAEDDDSDISDEELPDFSTLTQKAKKIYQISKVNANSYEGTFLNGLREGLGISSNDKDNRRYIGAWNNNRECGYGFLEANTGKYLGEFKNGEFSRGFAEEVLPVREFKCIEKVTYYGIKIKNQFANLGEIVFKIREKNLRFVAYWSDNKAIRVLLDEVNECYEKADADFFRCLDSALKNSYSNNVQSQVIHEFVNLAIEATLDHNLLAQVKSNINQSIDQLIKMNAAILFELREAKEFLSGYTHYPMKHTYLERFQKSCLEGLKHHYYRITNLFNSADFHSDALKEQMYKILNNEIKFNFEIDSGSSVGKLEINKKILAIDVSVIDFIIKLSGHVKEYLLKIPKDERQTKILMHDTFLLSLWGSYLKNGLTSRNRDKAVIDALKRIYSVCYNQFLSLLVYLEEKFPAILELKDKFFFGEIKIENNIIRYPIYVEICKNFLIIVNKNPLSDTFLKGNESPKLLEKSYLNIYQKYCYLYYLQKILSIVVT